MSRLQRLEDARPEYRAVPLQPFLTSLGESAALVCKQEGKSLLLQNETFLASAAFDAEFLFQVSGNLVSNAVRFARTSVTVSFRETEKGLLLTVSDDGDGFGENTICQAVKPFFTGNTQDADSCHSQHFGLGLYICKLLCEHHGGHLQLETAPPEQKLRHILNLENTLKSSTPAKIFPLVRLQSHRWKFFREFIRNLHHIKRTRLSVELHKMHGY